MNTDIKSILSEVIASLQMLLQAEQAETENAAMYQEAIEKAQKLKKDAEEGNLKEAEMEEAMKSFAKALPKVFKKNDGEAGIVDKPRTEDEKLMKARLAKEAEEALEEKKEEIAKSLKRIKREVAEMEAEDDKEEVKKGLKRIKREVAEIEEELAKPEHEDAQKSLLRRLKRALEGNASEPAEGVITSVNIEPEENNKFKKSIVSAMETIATRLNKQDEALSAIAQGMGAPIKKGAPGQLGEDALLTALAGKLEQRKQASLSSSEIHNNREALAHVFKQLGVQG